MSIRAAIYARQSVSEPEGIDQQVRALQQAAKERGFTVVGRPYTDDRTSASQDRGDGTGWADMLAAVDAGQIDVILVTEVTRLLRRISDVVEVIPPKRSVRVVAVREGIDTATAMGALMLTILAAFAQDEITRKEGRAEPYRIARHEAGNPAPGLVPYGYRWVPIPTGDSAEVARKRQRYAIDPVEASALRYASRELLASSDGRALRSIARALNDGTARDDSGQLLDPLTRLTRSTRNSEGSVTRQGVPWQQSTLRRMLLSPIPAALLPPRTPKGKKYDARVIRVSDCTPGNWEPILTEDEVIAAREILLRPDRRTNGERTTRPKWLLSGVGECGKCGGSIRKIETKTTAQSQRGYRCVKGCFQRPASLIEEYVRDEVLRLLTGADRLRWVSPQTVDVKALRSRRRAVDALMAEDQSLYVSGDLTPETLRLRNGQHRAELGELEHAIAEALAADPVADVVTSSDARALWNEASIERRRTILTAVAESVQIHPVGAGRRIRDLDAVAETVSIEWREARAEKRISFDRETYTKRVPVIPDGAHEVIADALG